MIKLTTFLELSTRFEKPLRWLSHFVTHKTTLKKIKRKIVAEVNKTNKRK